jgi:hypothetical protein
LAARDAEPVHRERRHREAVAGQPGAAGGALAAVDLEGDDDPLADLHPLHLGADLDHLGDRFVAVVEGHREGRAAEHDRPVEVAGGDGDRVDDRLLRTGRRRGRHAPPLDPPAGSDPQRPHLRPARPAPLGDQIPRRRPQPPDPQLPVAFEGHRARRHRDGGQALRQVAQPSVRSMLFGLAHRNSYGIAHSR